MFRAHTGMSHRMSRILVVASYTPSFLNFRGPLLREFLRRGHTVIACSPDPDPASLARVEAMGIRHVAYPLQRAGLNPLADWRTLRALRVIIQRERPDHVLAYTVKPVVYGCLAACRAGVPGIHALITGLGTAFQGKSMGRRVLNRIVSRLYSQALAGCTTVFFQNPDDRQLFVERGLVDAAKVTLVNGSGIDRNHFAPVAISDPAPRFLLVARLIEEKGVRVYAEAARLVKADYPEAEFLLVGYLEDHPGAIPCADVEAWAEAGVIEYCGSTDDVRPYLADTTVFCLPSYYREGVPRSILEALAVGRAIITTDAPGCRETVRVGENGFLVPVKDPAALAVAMRRFCKQPELVVSMGKASLRLAEKRFDVHRVNATMIKAMGLD